MFSKERKSVNLLEIAAVKNKNSDEKQNSNINDRIQNRAAEQIDRRHVAVRGVHAKAVKRQIRQNVIERVEKQFSKLRVEIGGEVS